jgi:hypothetical protein
MKLSWTSGRPCSASATFHGAPKFTISGIRVVGTCWRSTGLGVPLST